VPINRNSRKQCGSRYVALVGVEESGGFSHTKHLRTTVTVTTVLSYQWYLDYFSNAMVVYVDQCHKYLLNLRQWHPHMVVWLSLNVILPLL